MLFPQLADKEELVYWSRGLHQKASAVIVGGFVLGSALSRHVTKSHVMAIHPHFLYLARIDHFCRVDVRDNLSNSNQSHWIARYSSRMQSLVWWSNTSVVHTILLSKLE